MIRRMFSQIAADAARSISKHAHFSDTSLILTGKKTVILDRIVFHLRDDSNCSQVRRKPGTYMYSSGLAYRTRLPGIPGPILSVFPALIVHSELKSVHPGFPVAFIF